MRHSFPLPIERRSVPDAPTENRTSSEEFAIPGGHFLDVKHSLFERLIRIGHVNQISFELRLAKNGDGP